MKEINLEDILKKHSNICIDDCEDVVIAMREACKQTLELAAENVRIEIRKYNHCGEYEKENIGQEIMIEEPNIYIGISKESILDTINQTK